MIFNLMSQVSSYKSV